MPPNELRRAALPQSCAEGKMQAPGGGLPASRMHQVSARDRPCREHGESKQKSRPERVFHRHVLPLAFLHMTPALDKNTARAIKQNNSKVIR